MRTIQLISLDIRNIRGTREKSLNFGHRTVVAGDNGTGKTTVMDAFMWLCFGKDSQDRTDSGRGAFGIKTVDGSGNAISDLIHEVTGVMLVDGQTMRLTRRLTENWVKRRNTGKKELDGHTTTCIWNGSEIGVNEWNNRIETLIAPMNAFKMVTNPAYFCSLPWQEQLAELTRIVGTVTPEEIAKGKKRYEEQLAKVGGGNSLGDRLTTVNTERTRLKKRFDEIPSEIKGIKAVTPEAPDTAALECEKNALMEEQEAIDKAMSSVVEAGRRHYEAVQAKQRELHDVERKQMDVYSAALIAANEGVAKANEQYTQTEVALSAARQRVNKAEAELQVANTMRITHKGNHDRIAETLKEQKRRLLEEWEQVDGEVYSGGGALVCPLTGVACGDAAATAKHAADQEAARKAFNERKASRLDDIEKRGNDINARIKKADDELADKEGEIARHVEEQTRIREAANLECDMFRTTLAAMTKREPVTAVDKQGIAEWVTLEQRAEVLRGEIAEMEASTPQQQDESAAARKREIQQRLSEIAVEIAKETLIASNGKKVGVLEEEQKGVAQQMADMEKERDVILEIQRAVVEEVEKRVNSKFALVKFRTCDWQLNGEPVPTCYATINGVKYADLNTASQVNAGLDIINTLCREYGVSAPIFIDNAERVNSIIETDSQLVLLKVSGDKELNVTIEK